MIWRRKISLAPPRIQTLGCLSIANCCTYCAVPVTYVIVGMNVFIIVILQTKFDMLSCSDWLVVTIRPKAKEIFMWICFVYAIYFPTSMYEMNNTKLWSFNCSFLLMFSNMQSKNYNPRQWLVVFWIFSVVWHSK